MGASALYHLAKAGWTDCVLLEKNELTAGSTWHAAGNVPTFSTSWSIMNMQRYSTELYRGLGAAVDYPMNYHVTGSIRLAHSRERMQEFERAKGVPGLLLPMYRTLLERAGAQTGLIIDPAEVEDTLQRLSDLADALIRRGFTTLVLQQDDYFVYPPKTNHRTRRQDIGWVGMQEVRLDLLDEHLQQARSGAEAIVKPLIVYEEDRIVEETVSLQGIVAVVAEGTYTTVLENIDTRVFIDLTYLETLQSRLERARETQDDFLGRVLEIEHRII